MHLNTKENFSLGPCIRPYSLPGVSQECKGFTCTCVTKGNFSNVKATFLPCTGDVRVDLT